ncbi:MAG: HlyD family efflux transporter periplasmic adaptor subunit [Pseudomonadota bacterium]
MGVKVKRERPDQRRHHRVTAPFFVTLNAQRLRATDWSLGGFRLDDVAGALPAPGDEVELSFALPFQGFDVSFDGKAEVVRVNADQGMVAFRFTVLGERERELMQHFIEELVRGSMADIEDTIQRIDVPVTPASLEPDKKQIPASMPVRRWPMKAMVMTGIYAVLGLIVFGYIGLLSYSNFFRLEVQTAVITAPVEAVAAQAEGRIGWNGIKPGDVVRGGETVVTLFDNRLEREIDMAGLALKESEARLAYLKRRQAEELDRMADFARLELDGVREQRLRIEDLETRAQVLQRAFARVKSLRKRGFATNDQYDKALTAFTSARTQLASAKLKLRSRAKLARANIGKRYYNGDNIIGDVGRLKAEAELARSKHGLSQARFKLLLRHRRRLSVIAPFNGRVVELPRFNNGHVKRGDIVAIIERLKFRNVTAYLTQDEVLKIGQGDEALIFVPSIGETLKGRVIKIDRTSGFIQEQELRRNPGYTWRGPRDRSAKVIIAFDKPSLVDRSSRFRSGLPVVVIFPRRSNNELLNAITKRFSMFL